MGRAHNGFARDKTCSVGIPDSDALSDQLLQVPGEVTVALEGSRVHQGHAASCFVFVQQELAKYSQSFTEFPPLQKGASFHVEALKEEPAKKVAAHDP